jgi:DNA-binding transcriptional regulator YiaG
MKNESLNTKVESNLLARIEAVAEGIEPTRVAELRMAYAEELLSLIQSKFQSSPVLIPSSPKRRWKRRAAIETAETPGVMDDKESADSLIQRLKDYQREAGLSAAQLAKRLGVSVASVYTWYTGRWRPSLESLDRIRGVLARAKNENR